MTLSLAMIVKPDKEEAKLLDRCLKYLQGNVDEICITQAGKEPNKEVSKVIKKYGGKESFFKWIGDFSAARNFSFEQTTGDYIFWCDSDDVVRGAELLKKLVEKMDQDKIDAVVMNYLYDFDENKVCTVKHMKTRIVKRGCVEWVGEIHEDFQQKRELNSMFTDEIEILHLTDKNRAKQSSERNIEIAKGYMEKYPDDPRSEWLVANALIGEGRPLEAIPYLEKFVKISGSEEEVFIAYLRMAGITEKEEYYLSALSIKPQYPDAYLKLGEFLYKTGKLQRAKEFILQGLKNVKNERSIIVYNPRDYDYNPMMILAHIFFELRENMNALEVIKRLQKIYPENGKLTPFIEKIEEQEKEDKIVNEFLEKAEKIKEPKRLKRLCDEFPYKHNPKFCVFKNLKFVKEKSSGKDLVYYCGYTEKIWNPDVAMKDGVGGSEEAVVNLSKGLAKLGWNVTVYCNCGEPKVYDGVQYLPYYEFNYRDKQDVIILWRSLKPVDFDLNADKILIDLHDVVPEGELTEERLAKIHRVMVKTKAHRDLFPNTPDEKFSIIPNGIDISLFEEEVEKDPYLILNTSSPDRHIDATLDIFEELIKREPEKPWKLAWYYGWDNFLAWHSNDPKQMEFYEKNNARFHKLVKSGRAEGGKMISHKEIAKKYLEAGIFLYPTQFYEIHCISAAKAQAANCACVTSDFAALNETVMFGNKIHTEAEKWTKENTFGDTGKEDRYIEAIKFTLNHPAQREKALKTFNWENITKQWNNVL